MIVLTAGLIAAAVTASGLFVLGGTITAAAVNQFII